MTYAVPGAGSHLVAVWPEDPGYEGSYSLSLAPPGGELLTARFNVSSGTGMAPPRPSFSEVSSEIAWDAVPGAVSYECVLRGDAGAEVRRMAGGTTCDLSALPAGAWSASVLAYGADLGAIEASGSDAPELPLRFDVSEARLALAKLDGATPAAVLSVAGGGFRDGTAWSGQGLAVWVSILNGDGTPTALPWTVEIVGPGLPITAPLGFTYPANFSRLMIWSAAVPAASGSYGLVARSSAGGVARAFGIGALATLDAPTAVAARAGAQGAADVDWTGVIGAASYLVTARHGTTGAFVSSQWVAGTAASFPAGTFLADEPYAVYVAATDADMVGGTAPSQIAITENSYQPAAFVGR